MAKTQQFTAQQVADALTAAILAVYDGSTWRTTEGDRLDGVTHWRFRQ